MGLGAARWGELGYDLLHGMTWARAAKKYGVKVRAISDAADRLRETGNLGPRQTGVKKGTKNYKLRLTTQEQDKDVKPTVLQMEKQRGTTTARKVIKKMNLKIKRRTMADRIKEANLFASKGWNKKCYTKDEMKLRLRFARKYAHVKAERWEKVAFVDEHDVAHTAGEAREQMLASKKKHFYKERGTPYTNAHARPRGKNAKKGWGTMTRYCCAILKDRVIVNKPVEHYIKKAGPPPPRPPQRLTKNGKPMGRKRTRETTERPGSFCSRHWGLFLEDVAAAARKLLPGANPVVTVYQDNLALHKAHPAQAAAGAHNVSFWPDVSTDSPDKNCIENLFSVADEHLTELEGRKPAGSAAETNRRFETFMRNYKGVNALVTSMPRRLADVIAARGGPTGW